MGAEVPLLQQLRTGFHWLWLDDVSSKLKPRNVWDILWWKYMPGVIVEVRWPRGWWPLDESGNNSVNTSDPNDAYRWYLEK